MSDDRRLDALIESTLPPQPPDEVARGINPWSRAMSQILWGFGLCAVTFNFYALNYFLPAIGTLLMLCGFRTLRRENRCFMACYIIMALRTLWLVALLAVDSTVYASDARVLEFWQRLDYLGVAMQLATALLLWGGIRGVQARAGLPKRAGAAVWLFCWYAVVTLLALVGAQLGWLFSIALLIAFALIIRSLYKLYSELDEAGYAVRAAAGRVSNKTLVLFTVGVTAALMLCGYLFLSKFPMDWQPLEADGETEIRAELTELGFPEDVLADISDEDVAKCAGAVRVESDSEHYGDIRVSMAAVELSDREGHWLIFHHFKIYDELGLEYSGTEGIRLFPVYAIDPSSGLWTAESGLTGLVLYGKDGETLAAPYARIKEGGYRDSMLWGMQYSPEAYLEFSLPREAESVRGYVVSDALCRGLWNGGVPIDSYLELCHRGSAPSFPAKTAVDDYLANGLLGRTERIWSDYLAVFIED